MYHYRPSSGAADHAQPRYQPSEYEYDSRQAQYKYEDKTSFGHGAGRNRDDQQHFEAVNPFDQYIERPPPSASATMDYGPSKHHQHQNRYHTPSLHTPPVLIENDISDSREYNNNNDDADCWPQAPILRKAPPPAYHPMPSNRAYIPGQSKPPPQINFNRRSFQERPRAPPRTVSVGSFEEIEGPPALVQPTRGVTPQRSFEEIVAPPSPLPSQNHRLRSNRQSRLMPERTVAAHPGHYNMVSHATATTRPASAVSTCTIEVAPGMHMRLRGSQETWRAIEQDFYMPSECICCNTTLFCIQDAAYVLCPDCRVISPMEGFVNGGGGGDDGGGVGLGFYMEDLAQWQHEIVANQQRMQQYRM